MKGPKGANFEPTEYRIRKGDACEDLSFKLKGFSLKFAVKAKNQEGTLLSGPEGLKIELRRAGKPNVLATQTTDSEGSVLFTDITLPDTYEVKALPNEDITLKEDSVKCDLKWESGFRCEADYFLITGFSIKGKVLSYQDPMPNVNVYLHSGDTQISEKSKHFLQVTETDPQGVYHFTNIPVGHYQVVAVYSENQSKFQVEPDVLKANIDGKSVTLEPPFSVIGFSIFGRVLNSKGEGISGVKIIIDGQ